MKRFSGLLILVLGLAGCGAPNNVNISVSQGTCVQLSMYNSSVQESAAANYPNIVNNPQSAPYCAAITIQNNNSGRNGNNIQPISPGLTGSFTVGNTTYQPTSGNGIYDPIAGGFVIDGYVESIGNVGFYDPNNCMTSQGSQVKSLAINGNSCTFYTQLLGESNPVGSYPISLTYNYTNGNKNYSVSTTFNQQVNLYIAANNGVYLLVNGEFQPAQINGTPIAQSGIVGMTRDLYGYIYAATSNTLYQYNGINATTIAGSPAGITITSLTSGIDGAIYIGTSAGIYKYSPESKIWSTFNGGSVNSGSNIIGISSYQNIGGSGDLYAMTENNIYACNPTLGAEPCAWSTPVPGTVPTVFTPNQNALTVDAFGDVFTGNLSNINSYFKGSGGWTSYTITPIISGQFNALTYINASTGAFLYAGEAPQAANLTTESSVYSCTAPNGTPAITCTPLLSINGNPLFGNITAMTIDSIGNLFVAGTQINSRDFTTPGPYYGAYISESDDVTPITAWTPITGNMNNAGSVNGLKISSMLTTN